MLKNIRYLLQGTMFAIAYRCFGMLPIDKASALGGFLGRSFGPLSSRTRIARDNLIHAFPDLDRGEIDSIVNDMWDNLGRTLGEFPHVGRMETEEFHRLVTVEGSEHIRAVKQGANGSIFFSGHFANWELAPKTLAMHDCPLALVYRPGNNPLIDKLIQGTRDYYQSEPVPKGSDGSRQLVRALREKRHIGMLIDQKMNTGIAVKFMGREAMTATAIAVLALKFNCPVIPTRVERRNGPFHKITILPPLEITRTGDQDRDVRSLMEKINALFEEWIRAKPSQWIWVHNRWPDHS